MKSIFTQIRVGGVGVKKLWTDWVGGVSGVRRCSKVRGLGLFLYWGFYFHPRRVKYKVSQSEVLIKIVEF